jgi:hypothetical protein
MTEYRVGEARFHAFLSSRQMEVGCPLCISHFNQPERVPPHLFRAKCLMNMNMNMKNSASCLPTSNPVLSLIFYLFRVQIGFYPVAVVLQ